VLEILRDEGTQARLTKRPNRVRCISFPPALAAAGKRDGGAVRGDLAHHAGDLVAVEAHRDDGVRTPLAGLLAQPPAGLFAAVHQQLRGAAGLAAEDGAHARADV
jgi:hypothetical protein